MRSTLEFLSELRVAGVMLSLEGESLKCSAPKGVLTAELCEELTGRKQEILSFLRISREAARSGSAGIPRVDRTRALPLSFSQQRLWFLHQLDAENPAYNMAAALQLTGPLHEAVLEDSLSGIVRRHEALRTCFAQKDGVPYAVIDDGPAWRMERIDLRHIPFELQEEEMLEAATRIGKRPFDLKTGPLFRAALLTLAPESHVLVLVMHHIISDGWSMGVFVQEFTELYRAGMEQREAALPPLPVQYADYAEWHRRWLEGGEVERQLVYWKAQLAGSPAVVQFPADHPRPRHETSDGHRVRMVLPAERMAELERFGQREGVTLFMVMLAAFKTLLYRYTGQTDVVVGSPSANRSRSEFHGLIGFFVNNLVLRTGFEGNPSFRDLLGRVREMTLQAYDHQEVPFERLVQALRPERDLNHAPLFQTMFSFQNFPLEDLELSGLTIRLIEMDFGTARYDLTVEAWPRHGELHIDFEYNTHLYDRETMEQLQRHFRSVLSAVVADPLQTVNEIPLLSTEERRQLLEEWNGTLEPEDEALCFHQHFERQAQRTPDCMAVVAGTEALTYAELNERANRVAQGLRAAGAGPESLVALYAERSAHLLAGLLGILKSGAAYLPLDPVYPKQRIAQILEDAKPRVVLTQNSLGAQLPEHDGRVLTLEEIFAPAESGALPNLESGVTANDPAYVIFTSGSTGRPKGVQIPHSALMNFLKSMRREPGFTEHDVLLAVTTISFDIAGLELYLPLLAGGQVHIALEPGNAERLMADMRHSAATVMQATPATWQLLLAAGWEGDRRLKVLCGGEALEAGLAQKLIERVRSVWNMYGPTETTIWSSVLELREIHDGRVPLGPPIRNTSFFVLDARREPVPAGVAGELLIGGEGLAHGYLHRPELTAEKFVPHPFSDVPGARLYRTGDLVRRRRDGTLEFSGRLDHQVKLRGYRIEPGEIEAALRRQPGIGDAVVLLRDADGDRQLVAYLAAGQKPQRPSVAALRAALRQELPEYMVPAKFVFLSEFPRTPNGKLDRAALPAPEESGQTAERAILPPRTAMQRSIARVFCELLKIDRVSIDDNLFDLGAHSLLIVQAHERLKREIDPELSLVSFFQYPTIGALAGFLERQQKTTTVSGGMA
ncbi:non-ribosomal peptide synthetase [Paracidobacterium acidisoli]|uniref:Amino acid adenylation domain-containing protein n=1 Tax=Paracidobacterium acidisoli TaxID=2303751 RepID=A0A372ILI6_9BACT|nr:non-ribosomal peptide synthetase [Paracidobacterium acidisoli]MBT9332218.1 amino acid adenylation domain-containing protein [Paracidobacterium acidisoli]